MKRNRPKDIDPNDYAREHMDELVTTKLCQKYPQCKTQLHTGRGNGREAIIAYENSGVGLGRCRNFLLKEPPGKMNVILKI